MRSVYKVLLIAHFGCNVGEHERVNVCVGFLCLCVYGCEWNCAVGERRSEKIRRCCGGHLVCPRIKVCCFSVTQSRLQWSMDQLSG